MADINQKINDLMVKINFIEDKLSSLKYYSEMASIEISQIMEEYNTRYFQMIIFALRENTVDTDTLALGSINELKKQTLDRIEGLQRNITFYDDVSREHQCLLIQYGDLVDSDHSSSQNDDSFSKIAEMVSQDAEDNILNQP